MNMENLNDLYLLIGGKKVTRKDARWEPVHPTFSAE
jgi:hypothetical protein